MKKHSGCDNTVCRDCPGLLREGERKGLLRAARRAEGAQGLVFGTTRWVSTKWLRAEAKKLKVKRG